MLSCCAGWLTGSLDRGQQELCAWLAGVMGIVEAPAWDRRMRDVAFAAARASLYLWAYSYASIHQRRCSPRKTSRPREKATSQVVVDNLPRYSIWICTSSSPADFSPAAVEQSCRGGASWIGGRILAATPSHPTSTTRARILEWAGGSGRPWRKGASGGA